MTNEEQKLREIAYKRGITWEADESGYRHAENRRNELLSDLTALIEEHYYPKEEITNAVCPSCESENCVLIAVPRNRCKDCGVEWEKENVR